MGFIQPIRRILALLPAERQNLLFSATFSEDVGRLAGSLLREPASVDVAPRNTAAELVDQLVIPVDRRRKRELLSHLVRSRRIDQTLVFARTKHTANRLAEQLYEDGIAAAAIHGNKSQSQRVRALNDFKAGRVTVLVATDIAARGIDIESLPHVVNYELPVVASDYVHRIGRTGRAGVDGQAISLVCIDEAPLLRDIEALLRHPIASEVVPGFEPDRSIRAEPIRFRSAVPPRAQHGRPRPSQAPVGRPQPGRAHAGRPQAPRPQRGRPQPAWQGSQPHRNGGSSPSHAPWPRNGGARQSGSPTTLPGERLQRYPATAPAIPRRD
jgi:ATP-dependent RNA helicase RhlE